MEKNVLLVGHCGVDAPRIQQMLASVDRACSCEAMGSEIDLRRCIDERSPDLVLFNRELPPGFDERSGAELIRRLREEYPETPMMLVSDYPDAQRQAIEAGALPGFGKSELASPRVAKLLRSTLSQ